MIAGDEYRGTPLVFSKNQARCIKRRILGGLTMTRVIRVLALSSSMLAVAGLAVAQGSMAPAKPAATAPKKPVKTATATSMVATGKIAKFDAASNMLTVTTSTGDVTFMVGTTAKVQDGAKMLKAADLATDTGKSVTVRYSEKDGMKNASSVRLTAAAAPKAAPKAPVKK
jgi:hypothetical protein